MGDHRNQSEDSRCHIVEDVPGEPRGYKAFVPVSDIVGTAVAVVFPFNRVHGLSRPATFADIPAPGAAPSEPVIKGNPTGC